MSISAEEWLKRFKSTERDLLKCLNQKDPTFSEIDTLLTGVRAAFENLAFADLSLATAHDAETRLWDHHGKINSRYRRQLAKFRDEEGKKKPVEKRKLEKHYLDFIKSSMRFYRSYIQRLASHYGEITELSQVASRFKVDTTSIDAPVVPSAEIKGLIVKSCHATLVRLGDLSRYRETELQTKERNWGPAIGYYDLATYVIPSSGLPHNQLAVIALADGQHVRALYQLYRAQAVTQPHPSAKGNLDIEFKKIIQLKTKNELFPRSGPMFPERTVDAWFSYLHALCEKGDKWPEHEDMENELLSQLSVLVKEKAMESQLQKFSLINMAAEYIAGQQARGDVYDEGLLARFQFYQRLNLKTFFMLLQILLPELASEDEVAGLPTSSELSERLSPITRRILPSLRHYSSWLLSNASFLVVQENDPVLGVHIREFWKIYASALTLLAGTFPVLELPVIEYLLEEDEDTIGFLPVFNENTLWRYHSQPDVVKPHPGDKDTPKELPNVEMLFRIRELLANGMELTAQRDDSNTKSIPIELVQGARFVYQEEGLPREFHSDSQSRLPHSQSPPTASINRDDIERDRLARSSLHVSQLRKDDERSTAASTSNNTMANMVSNLVDSDATDQLPVHDPQMTPQQFAEFPSSIPFGPSQPFPTTKSPVTARDLVKNMQQGPGTTTIEDPIRPLSSSIWTPLPGETRHGSPQTRPGTSNRNLDPLSTPLAQPSSSSFLDQLQRQHQQIHARSSSINSMIGGTPSSWISQENIPLFDPQQQQLGYRPSSSKGTSSPWGHHPTSSAASLMPSPFGSRTFGDGAGGMLSKDEVVPRSALSRGGVFGAIGQTPPSGQGE